MLPRAYEYSEVHMGLPVRIVLYASDEARARAAAGAAFERIAALDRMMSDYRPDSELRRLEQHYDEWTPASPELFDVVERAVSIARASDGAFDPSVAPLVALWREARKTRRLPDASALDAARALVGWRRIGLDRTDQTICLRPGTRLDLGGIAKGYILQEGLKILRSHGVDRALLEAGGDIMAGAAPPGRDGWSVETPSTDRAFRERARALTNVAIATSGASAQFVEIDGVRYSHVIDPHTGYGLTNHFVAHVIAPDAADADALATALTVMGPEKSRKLLGMFPGAVASIERER